MQPHVAARLDGWDPGSVVGVSWGYIDDVVVGRLVDDMDLHEAHLRAVLTACVTDDIHLKCAKCAFPRAIAFWGADRGQQRCPNSSPQVSTVTAWDRPTRVRGVQGFPGSCDVFGDTFLVFPNCRHLFTS